MAQPGAICLNALAQGRQLISAFVFGATAEQFDQMLKRLHIKLNEQGLIDLDTWMIDSTSVRAPEPLLVQGKRGPEEPQDHALGRSRSGLTTKLHISCDANGIPLRFLLSGGLASDIAYVQPLLDEAYIPSLRGRARKRCRWFFCGQRI